MFCFLIHNCYRFQCLFLVKGKRDRMGFKYEDSAVVGWAGLALVLWSNEGCGKFLELILFLDINMDVAIDTLREEIRGFARHNVL